MFSTKEVAVLQLFKNNTPADFSFCCKIIFALQKISNSNIFPTFVTGKDKSGKVLVMSENYEKFCEQVKNVMSCSISFIVGDTKIPFSIETGMVDGTLNVSCSIYHTEDVSSTTIIDILKHKITEVINYLDICENIFQFNDKILLTNFSTYDKMNITNRHHLHGGIKR